MGGRRIRDANRQGRYEFTLHALEEMAADGLNESDVRSILQGGRIIARLDGDSRGERFAVQGAVGQADRGVEIICRFLPSGILRIITAYRLEG